MPDHEAPHDVASSKEPSLYGILKYPWHTAHDYELSKLPHQFYYLTSTPREWAGSHRPIPENIAWVPHHDTCPTDVMILHVDQWTIQEPAKRHLFLHHRDRYRGPKIVINHGSNLVDGCSSSEMKSLIQDSLMVCNSETARQAWDVPNSVFIRHGMSPREWPSTNYARHNIVVTQPYSKLHSLCRNTDGIERAEARVPIVWIGRDLRFDSFAKYRHYLQASSIFLQPSYASANPRSRTEAMLTGLAIVTTDMHGESDYIENDVNGFCSNDFDELIAYLEYLYRNPVRTREIGQAGRATAQKLFNSASFVRQWQDVLSGYLQ